MAITYTQSCPIDPLYQRYSYQREQDLSEGYEYQYTVEGIQYNPETGRNDTVPTKVFKLKKYEGCVIDQWEENRYDDSDFGALVWDEEKQAIRTEYYASTRFAGGGYCEIDYTPETMTKALEYVKPFVRRAIFLDQLREAESPEVFKIVRVVRGRTVPKGTVGKVTFVGINKYTGVDRVQIETANKDIYYIDWRHLEVIGLEKYLPTEEQLDRATENVLQRLSKNETGWRYYLERGK